MLSGYNLSLPLEDLRALVSSGGRFLDACRRRATDVRPVWFMRQAGRYLKQYRDIRSKHGILEICKRPDLAAEVTLQPIDILGVDAAIIFADLLLPVEPMGLKLEFRTGEGPHIDNPITERTILTIFQRAERTILAT